MQGENLIGTSRPERFGVQRFVSDAQIILLGIIGALQLFAILVSIGLFTATGVIKVNDNQKSGGTFTAATFFFFFAVCGFIFTQAFDKQGRIDYWKRIQEHSGLSKWAQAFKNPGPAVWFAIMIMLKGTVDVGESAREIVSRRGGYPSTFAEEYPSAATDYPSQGLGGYGPSPSRALRPDLTQG